MLTSTELANLEVMYAGDKDRDATSKIRGFLYQDYVTVMCLLQDGVEYVCSEYLEDIDVFYQNGTFEFIQVKYYPKTSPRMKEISTDLYFQFLRLKMLGSKLTAKPKLLIHRNSQVSKPTLDDMKQYLNLDKSFRKTVTFPLKSDEWLKKNVYTTNKKDKQKENLFGDMAAIDTAQEFLDAYEVIHKPDITAYKDELMKKLAAAYKNPAKAGDNENWQLILLGLAISYIQRRYTLEAPDFDELRVDKQEFDKYMNSSIQTKTERTIASYLAGIVCNKSDCIIEENTTSNADDNLSGLQIQMLNLISYNTVQWIQKLGETIDGQYALVNTFSMRKADEVKAYKTMSIDDRLTMIAECKDSMDRFLEYLWKIMMDICQEKINDESEFAKYPDILDPSNYVISSINEYICFKFPGDPYEKQTVILPPVGKTFNRARRILVERMIKTVQKPEKWFLENSKMARGKNYYSYTTAEVREDVTITELGDDSFYIECMDCIGIDEGEWQIKENCASCIFSDKCVKGVD